MCRIGWVVALASLLTLAYRAQPLPSLARDNVFETYSQDLLSEAERHQTTILLVQSDSVYFNLRYQQLVFGRAPSVLVLSPELLFHPWYLQKALALQPKFQLPEAERILRLKTYDLVSDLLQPNLAAGLRMMSSGVIVSKALISTTHVPLGRLLEIGTGSRAELAREPLHPPALPAEGAPQAHSKKLLVAQYANYSMAKSLAAYENHNIPAAIAASEEALALVPFAHPALLNLCRLLEDRDPRCTPEAKAMVFALGEGYFP